MKKQNKNILLGIILVVLILIGLSSQGIINSPLSSGGFSTLSLGQVDFISNDPSVGGQAWLLTVSQNGAGQYATGSFKLNDGQSSSDNFNIRLSLDKNYASYPIYNQGVFIKSVDWDSTTYNPFSSTGGCNSDYWQNWIKPGGTTKVYCYNFKNSGVYGTVGSANVNFQTSINVDGSGGSDSCVVSNIGSASCFSSKGKIQSSWVGSLVSGQSPPQPYDSNIIAVYDTNSGGWKTANGNSYSNYKNFNLANCLGISGSNGQNCFNNYNSLSSSVMSGYPFKSSGGDVATTSGSQSNGQVILNLPTQVQFPVITMRIKADLIGINIPVGKPKIISLSSTEFQTGQSGIIETTIQNVGSSEGSFDVSALCSSGFNQIGNALRINLQPSETQKVYLPISANTISDKAGSCEVKVNDVNNPNVFDIKSVSVSTSAIVLCTSGDQRILGNAIQQCQSNVWTTIKTCLSGEIAQMKNGVPSCVLIEDAGQSFWSKIKNFFLHPFSTIGEFVKGVFNFTGEFVQTIKNIVTIIVGIFAFLFGVDLFAQFKFTKNKKWVSWVLALIVAGLISYVAYISFWIGIITFIVWIVYRLIIGNKIVAVRKGIRRIRRS